MVSTENPAYLAVALAESYLDNTSQLLSLHGLQLEEAAKNGILALDVGYGPEIVAFGSLTTRLVATEPYSFHMDRQEMNASLAAISVSVPHLRLVRDYPISAMKTLATEDARFGLITRLRMFPEAVAVFQPDFFRMAKKLLAPAGILLVSWDQFNENDSIGTDLIRAFYHVCRDENPVMTVYDREIVWDSPPGGLYLLAQI